MSKEVRARLERQLSAGGIALEEVWVGGVWRRTYTVECVQCGSRMSKTHNGLDTVDQVKKLFLSSRWRQGPGSGGWCCPKCQGVLREKKESTMKTKQVPVMAQTLKVAEPTPLSAAQMVKATRLLTEHFDAAAGAYAEGWSDDVIAQDVGGVVGVVAAFRAEHFGELRIDPTLQALLSDVAGLKSILADVEARVESYRAARAV